MQLSKRLSEIFTMVEPGSIVGDIGADHGLLIMRLIRDNICSIGFCNDNKIGPYNNLKSAIESNNLSDKIEVSLSDGIEKLPSYVNTLVIAGMGGELIIEILNKNIDKLQNIETLILSPHTSTPLLRKAVNKLGYMIKHEVIIKDRHYYEIILFKKGNESLTEQELTFGPVLLKTRTKFFVEKYKSRLDTINRLLEKNLDEKSRAELLNEKEGILKL